MDRKEFEAAFANSNPEPDFDVLLRRFQRAFETSRGDTQTAMAAVNELLETPMQYEEFHSRMRAEG